MQARKVVFHVSVETGDLLIQVVDGETGDIVRQIPPDEVIAFMRRFREVLGLLLDEKI
jgi:flagellar protein FlaG